MKFKKPIEVQAGISDGDPTNPLGQAGYLLSSDGTNVNWVSPGGLSAETAEAIVQPIKASGALAKGDPVYIVGYQNGQNVNIVAKADSSDAAKMPVVGLADDDYANNNFGTMTAFGSFNGNFDTTGGTENWAVGDIIFVKAGGGLTNVKPTGTDLIQNIAIVSRVQQNTGELEVIALGRTNDVPNLPAGRLFVGTNDNTSLISDVVYVDDTNDRVGIGTTAPGSKLTVSSGVDDTSLNTARINHVRNNAVGGTQAVVIDMNLSGADITTENRQNSALYIDVDSSADGDASNQHRVRGITADVKFSGFSDSVQAGYFYAESNNTTQKTAQIIGVQGQAVHDSDSVDGGVSNMYGVYGLASIQDLGDVDNAYGGFFLTTVTPGRGDAGVGITKGVEGKVAINKAETINYMAITAVSGIIDNNEGTAPAFGNQYLFKGDYQGTKGAAAYGIWCEGDKHYFDGNVGIGVTNPSAKLQVYGNITSTYNAADTDTGAYGISRTLSGLTVNARGYRDNTIITSPGNNAVSYAGIDLKSKSTSGTYGHVTMFQGRHSLDAANLTDFEGLYIGGLNFTNSSSATNYVGVTVENPTSFSGTITNFIGTKIDAPIRTGGTITNFYGLKIEDSVSATNKWGIYSEDTSVKSKMLGQLESGDISVYNTDTNASLNLNSSSTASGGNYIHAKKSDGTNQWVLGSNNANDDRLTLKQYNAANIIFANNSGDAMVIDTAGNVGIGNTGPNYPLVVNGVAAANRFYIPNVSSTNAWALQVRNSANTADSGLYFENGDAQLLLRDDENNLNVRINSDTDSYINGGNVGIGVTSPSTKLDVDGTGTFGAGSTYALNLKSSSGSRGIKILSSDGTYRGGIDWNTVDFFIRDASDAKLLSLNYSTKNATLLGNVEAVNFILSSDERKKTKIKDLACNNIDVNWRSFELKQNEGDYRTGVIAQELEEKHPEFVNTDDEGFKSVKYIDLLIAKIAELEARLEKAGI